MKGTRGGHSTALARYFSDIRRYPQLSREQEHTLAVDLKTGSTHARDELVEANLSFVVKVASEYRNLGVPFEDLLNEGNLGLIEAAQCFDASKGTKFITYAIWWIRKSILKALSEHSNLVRVPTYQRKQFREIREAEESLSQALGRKPRREEVSRWLDQKPSRIDRVLQFGLREMSLDDMVAKDSEKPVSEYLVNLASPNPEDDLIQRESNCLLAEAIHQLNKKERTVILHRFGMADGPALTLHELGKKMNLSRERVRQIEWKAVRRMRRLFTRKPCVTAPFKRPFLKHSSVKPSRDPRKAKGH